MKDILEARPSFEKHPVEELSFSDLNERLFDYFFGVKGFPHDHAKKQANSTVLSLRRHFIGNFGTNFARKRDVGGYLFRRDGDYFLTFRALNLIKSSQSAYRFVQNTQMLMISKEMIRPVVKRGIGEERFEALRMVIGKMEAENE